MAKVLLIYDDMKLLTHTEMVLKKISFDVLGIGNELSLKESLLGFNPDVVIGFGASSKVNSMSVGRRIAEVVSYKGKVILCVSQASKPSASEMKGIKLDVLIESPIDDKKIIEAITKILNLPPEIYFEKYARIMAPTGSQLMNKSAATSEIKIDPVQVAKRVERNKKFLSDPDFKAEDRIKPQEAKKVWKKLESEWDSKELERLDSLKKDFVRALFSKKG